MISYRFSGYQNSNLFVRADAQMLLSALWTRQIVPLIIDTVSNSDLDLIKRSLGIGDNWLQGLAVLLDLGAVYMDQNRKHSDFTVDPTNVVRIHLMPRRYDTLGFPVMSHIVFESSDYLIVDKPAAIPIHPTLDNSVENVLTCLQRQISKSIVCVHRLDLETTGLVLFAKNNSALRYYQNLFAERQIKKYYKAIVGGFEAKIGRHQHWMVNGARAPKKIQDVAAPATTAIEMIVRSSDSFKYENSYVVDIELLTGKTHQIRAQLSHLGSPLLGDSMYGGPEFPKGVTQSHFLLHAYCLEFTDQSGEQKIFIRPPRWLA